MKVCEGVDNEQCVSVFTSFFGLLSVSVRFSSFRYKKLDMGQRWKRYCEIYLICSVWPIALVSCVYGGWRLMLWSYGGRDMFRRMVITDPLDEEWHLANPRQIFFRDAPLAHLPDYLQDYQKSLQPKDSPQHQHHSNY